LRSGDDWCNDLAVTGFADLGTAALTDGPWPSSVIWGRAPSTITPSEQPSPISIHLITTDSDSAVFHAPLTQAGHRIGDIDAAGFCALPVPDDVDADGGEIAMIVVEDTGEVVEQSTRLIALAARVAAAAAERRVPLWLVTSGAQQQSADGTGIGL